MMTHFLDTDKNSLLLLTVEMNGTSTNDWIGACVFCWKAIRCESP